MAVARKTTARKPAKAKRGTGATRRTTKASVAASAKARSKRAAARA